MVGEDELAVIETRVARATGNRWGPVLDFDGSPAVSVQHEDGSQEVLRITREEAPASLEDVQFIAASRQDLVLLIETARGRPVASSALDAIELRCSQASPAPWTAFLESDGGMGGTNVIRVSEGDDEPDLYLWMGRSLATDADFEFVASARQDIPKLLAAARHRGKWDEPNG